MNGKKAKKIRRMANAMVAMGWATPEQKTLLYRRLKKAWHNRPELFKGDGDVRRVGKEGH